MYTFQSESTSYSCLNVKEPLARNRRDIWSLSDCNGTRIHNHWVCKRTPGSGDWDKKTNRCQDGCEPGTRWTIKRSTHFYLEIPTNATFLNIFPMIILLKDMNYVHSWIECLFSQEIPNMRLAGRLRHFLQNWKILTQYPNILSIMEGYKILFLSPPAKTQNPKGLSQDQKSLVSRCWEMVQSEKCLTYKESSLPIFFWWRKEGGITHISKYISKKLELIHSISTLQNGKFAFSEIPPWRNRRSMN